MEEILEKTAHVYALLCEDDKRVLGKYAAQVPDGGIIIDIGTARGGSAFIMALASKPSVKLYTFDPTDHTEYITDWIQRLGLESKVDYQVKTTEEMAEDWDKDIDMVFIDGRHHYDGVMEDYEAFGTRVKKGGIVAFHDVILYDNTIGYAVQDLVKQGKIKELETIRGHYKEDPRIIGLFVGEKL